MSARTIRSRRRWALLITVAAIAWSVPAMGVGAEPAGPVTFADSFDRADGTLGVADTGQSWSQWHGSFSVQSGSAGASVGGYSLAVADAGTSNGVVSVRVARPAAEHWMVFRASDAASYWRFGRSSNGPYVLQQIVGNALGAPAVQPLSSSPVAAAGDLLACDLDGPSIRCSVNGTPLLQVTDGFNQGATRVGLAAYEGGISPILFDDMEVLARPATEEPPPPVDPPSGMRLGDAFERADSTQLGTADTGQPWTQWHGAIGVSSGRAAPVAGGYSMAVTDGGGPDGLVSATVAALSDEYWLVLRASDPANYWRFGRTRGSSYVLQQIVDNGLGSPSVLLHDTQPAAGDQVSCALDGPWISCSVNGSLVASAQSSSNASAELVGLAAYGASVPTVRFDDLAVVDIVRPDDARPALAVAVDGAAATLVNGGISWTATVTNAGTGEAREVTLAVSVPAGVQVTGAASSAGPCLGTSPVTCSLGTLPAGRSTSVTVHGTAPPEPTTLTATFTAATQTPGDPDPSDDSATATTVVEAPSAGARVVDWFDRADSSQLGSADTGQAWSTWYGGFGVRAGAAAPLAGGYSLAVVDTGGGDGTVSVTATEVSTEFWLVLRASDPASYWRFGRSADSTYVLQQIANNSLGPPVPQQASVRPAAGDRVACRTSDASIACSVNGTTVASVQSSFNADAARVGLATYGPEAPAARFERFEVADLPAAADLSVTVVDTDPVFVDEPVTLTVAVTNTGLATAEAVELAGATTPQLTQVSAASPAGACTVTASVRCAIGSLSPGQTATVTVRGIAPPEPTAVTTTVTASMADVDPTPDDNRADEATTVRRHPQPGARLADGFERPDALGLGTADTGQQWNQHSGAFAIEAGRARAVGDAASMATLDDGFAFGTFEVKVERVGDGRFWAVFRAVDQDNYFRLGRDPWSGYYRVEKVVGGQVSSPQFHLVRTQVSPADGDVIRIVNRPDDGFFVAINGVHAIDGGDLDLLGATGFGIRTASDQPAFGFVDVGQLITTSAQVRDSFDLPDGSAVGAPTTGVSYRWWVPWLVDAGRAYHPGGHFGINVVDAGSERGDVSVVVTRTGQEHGLVFRYSEAGTYYRFGSTGASPFYELDFVGGPAPTPVRHHADITPADGDVLLVRQTLDGHIAAYVNGTLTRETTDPTTNARWTLYGLTTFGSDARFDDFTVMPK